LLSAPTAEARYYNSSIMFKAIKINFNLLKDSRYYEAKVFISNFIFGSNFVMIYG